MVFVLKVVPSTGEVDIAIGGKSMLKVTEPVGFSPERFGFVQSCAKYKWLQKREDAHFFVKKQ